MPKPTADQSRVRNTLHRLVAHFRRQWAGFLALFLVLTTGSAYALAGSNTVFSDDIVNGNVRTGDIAPDAVTSGRVADGAIDGDHILNASVSGTDIVESTLNTVPLAAQGGTGRYGFSGQCDPQGNGSTDSPYVDCSTVQITLPYPGRLLLTGTVTAEAEAEWAIGQCRLEVDGSAILTSVVQWDWDAEDRSGESEIPGSTTAVSHVLTAGNHIAGVECLEDRTVGGDGRIRFPSARVTAVALAGE